MIKGLNSFCLITIIVGEENMHKFFKPLSLFVMGFSCSAYAEPILFQNSQNFSSKNVEMVLQRMTQEPHPMGSSAQKKLAQDLRDSLSQFGLKSYLQKFTALSPNLDEDMKSLKTTTGYNVIAVRQGSERCAVILSGHYDTKFFQNAIFVGANDGGSSTALLLELARVVKHVRFNKQTLGSCSLYFVLFDGEEAFLPNWDDGIQQFKIEDNLYGSRNFVETNLKTKDRNTFLYNQPISLVLVLDMIGHLNQNLFITEGSDSFYTQEFTNLSDGTKISASSLFIEDDHVPFLKKHVPLLHIIDWTNLAQWHTVKDNLKIISYNNITLLGKNIIKFLENVSYSQSNKRRKPPSSLFHG